MCFLELCRPSEMPQSMDSCWTLHCFMHVWWIYISLDGNFFWIGTGQSFNTEAFDMLVKVINLIMIQLIFGFGNNLFWCSLEASPDAPVSPFLCDRYRWTYMYLYIPTRL